MKVLGLCSYPVEAAATRFRLEQYVGPLGKRGISLDIEPFLDSVQFAGLYSSSGLWTKFFGIFRPLGRRIARLATIGRYDMILVQREAMPFGPAIFELLYMAIGRIPMVLDLDDATYVRYVSPSYGRLGSFFKFFGKTDRLIERSSSVVCGNRFIADHAISKGTRATIIPTVVDLDQFCPADVKNEIPVIGWIGTHSTYPFLESLFPVFERLAQKHRFILRIIGSGRKDITLNGLAIEHVDWSLEREIEDFRTLDIGLYPIIEAGSANQDWIKGKSGFKAIQYMAVGIPFVMSPVGICAEIGESGTTHINAETGDDWYNSLDSLLGDSNLRSTMGSAGRQFAVANFDLEKTSARLADALRSVFQDETQADI